MFKKRYATDSQVAMMRETALRAADAIDDLRAENEQLRIRGRRLVDAINANDGSVHAAWQISNALSAWAEYDGVVPS